MALFNLTLPSRGLWQPIYNIVAFSPDPTCRFFVVQISVSFYSVFSRVLGVALLTCFLSLFQRFQDTGSSR